MPTQLKRFCLSPSAQDRFKIPNVLWVGLKSIGLTPGAVLRRSNLPLTLYGGEKSQVSTMQFFSIWRAIDELGKDPSAGWKLASRVETAQYHPATLAALHARTFHDAIERMARYKQLCCAEEMKIAKEGGDCVIECSWPFAEGPVPALLTDAVFAAVTELGRRGTRTNLAPKRIELRRTVAPGNGFEDYFRCPVKYRATRDAITLRSADLEMPFVTHNEEMLKMLTPQLERELEKGKAQQNVLDQVKWVLKRLLSGSRPDILMVAKELGMSGRTLQRRITEEGASFRQLLNDTRQELVRQYLSDPTIEINEAAFLLGYEDPNSFYRAFRTWEGTTPAHWRSVNKSAEPQRN